MKKFIVPIFLFLGINLFAQIHNSDTTLVINKQKFNITRKEINPDKVKLTIKRNSKIIKTETLDADGLADVKFPDFDKDGNKDIMLVYMGNNFTYYLYLFDKINNTFKKVEGFDKFPEAIQLKTNSKFYYSYHRAGCADMNWVSDLFYIDNFKAIHIGHIFGRGCASKAEKDPLEIEVEKVFFNDKANIKRIETLPYLKNSSGFDSKWDFIEQYWNKNYRKFI